MINDIIKGIMSSKLLICFPVPWYGIFLHRFIHTNTVVNISTTRSQSLRSEVKRFVNINTVVYCDIFGCEIWGFHPAKPIKQVHKDFCKSILK